MDLLVRSYIQLRVIKTMICLRFACLIAILAVGILMGSI